jgi:hypothetical protein
LKPNLEENDELRRLSNKPSFAHAKTLAEEDKLIEAGFDFVRYSETEQVAIYRKRK